MATRRRRTTTDDPGAGREPFAGPSSLAAVREALASGSGAVAACEVVGADLAREGWSLAEALDALAQTTWAVRGAEPEHAETRTLAVAWSEATLAYLHGLSCEDPLTGLATLAHLRTQLADLVRPGAGAVQAVSTDSLSTTHALVVVHATEPSPEALDRAMRSARLGATVRSVFAGRETIARAGPLRVLVLAERDDRLPRRVDLLRRMLGTEGQPRPRVWIEGLPDTDDAAAALLDELARP